MNEHDKIICQECGMTVKTREFHPYEFCILYKNGQDPRALYQRIVEHSKSGAFDMEPDPVSDLKPGDRVRHKDMPYLGTGIIQEISKSGKRARVEWGDDWDRKRLNWAPYPAYYRLDKLEKVEGSK